MPIRIQRWCDPIVESKNEWRILICRYRPRGLPKYKETWNIWLNQLGPSPELHARAYGKTTGVPLEWDKYTVCYLKEMEKKQARDLISCLAELAKTGRTITLMCSSACVDENRCHRKLLQKLIEARINSG